jgi:D-aminopeptidase
MRSRLASVLTVVLAAGLLPARADAPRPRLRDWGVVIGALPTGPLNAITDVPGVRVGHVTVARGTAVNTGVTAILAHERNLVRDKVRAAVVVGNGFGKLASRRSSSRARCAWARRGTPPRATCSAFRATRTSARSIR